MKNSLFAAILVTLSASFVNGQIINWTSLDPQDKHIVSAGVGYDYGFVFGAAYSYQLKSPLPAVVSVSQTFPSGGKLLDDFKTKIGAEVRICHVKDFQLGLSARGIYRQYRNPLVRLLNFGSEFETTVGYYRPKWFVAADFGFDKAIVTHFRHSAMFRENIYADAKDGWYEPATGGNFHYGLKAGYSFGQHDITVGFGKVATEDFKSSPLIPYSCYAGYNWRIGSKKSEKRLLQ